MKLPLTFSSGQRIVTVTIPLAIRRHGGRKQVIAPNGGDTQLSMTRQPDKTLTKALGRAFRWQGLLDSGSMTSIQGIARNEKINAAYVGRVLRLTLLAPDLIKGILNGDPAIDLRMIDISHGVPADWAVQRERFSHPQTLSGEAAG